MPRITNPCDICGRAVDMANFRILDGPDGKLTLITVCVNRRKCDRAWSRWDRLIYGKKHEVRMQVERVAEEIFRVTSETAADKKYAVDLSEPPNCTCTHWATQRNKLVSQARREGRADDTVRFECKHVKAAMARRNDPISDQKTKTQALKDEVLKKYTKDRTRENLVALFEELKDA